MATNQRGHFPSGEIGGGQYAGVRLEPVLPLDGHALVHPGRHPSGLLFLLNLQNILLVDTLESTGMGPLSQRADKHKVTCHDSCNRSNHVFYL